MVIAACLFLLVATTLIHYHVLWGLSGSLLHSHVAPRTQVVIVILTEMAAHGLQIALYGLAIYALIHWAGAGTLSGTDSSLAQCLFFSAETFTSLGYGDVVPTGSLRLLAGVETLNGLILIGWSASYTYIVMNRHWDARAVGGGRG